MSPRRWYWAAEADGVAHCSDSGLRTLCGQYGMDPRYARPAVMQCESCVEVYTLMLGEPPAPMPPASSGVPFPGARPAAAPRSGPSIHPALAKAAQRTAEHEPHEGA